MAHIHWKSPRIRTESVRYLAPAECKYSQLDKEALAIIFGVKRFHQYLLGRSFKIHKPLQH